MSLNRIASLSSYRAAPWALAMVLTILMLAPPMLKAQGTANILGTVTDPTGAVIPDAKVTAKNTGTAIERTVQTGKNGEYAFTALQLGTYNVTIEAAGFKTYVAKDLTLAVGDRARVDAKMEIGGITENIEISAEAAPALQTQTSTVGTLITEQTVQNLPLNGRNFISLVQMSAGVNAGLQNSISNGTRDADRRQTSAFSVNGQFDIYNSNLIDGMDNNERFVGTVGVKPSIDAIQEVKVSTNLFSAEYSRAVGGVVDVITKSGTNDYHGSLYEFWRNDKLDARNFFAKKGTVPKPEFRQNQFGGSLGGPIFKNRTFFFGDYEGFRQISGYNVANNVVPSAAIQDAVAAAPVGTTLTFQDPSWTSANNPTGTYQATVSEIGKKMLALYPHPNSANNYYISAPARSQFSHTFDARVDHHFNEKDTLFVRYSYNKVDTVVPGAFPGVTIGSETYYGGGSSGGGTMGNSFMGAQHVSLNYLHIFRPNLLLELKAGYMRFNNSNLTPNGVDAATHFGFVCNATECVNAPFGGGQYGLPGMSFSGGYSVSGTGDGGFIPLFDINNTFMYSGSLTWNKGGHSVKAGLSLVRRQVARQQSFSARGSFSFGGNPSATGNPLGDMIEGIANGYNRDQMLGYPSYRMWEPGGFIMDDWRVNKWLTLNLGVRYDIFSPQTEKNGYMSNFDPNLGLMVSPVLLGVQHSSNTAGVKTDFGDIAPRLGFAASLGHGLVVRGGYGITYFPTAQGPNSALNNAPFSFNLRCAGTLCTNADANGLIDLAHHSEPVPVYDTSRATITSNYAGTNPIGIMPDFKPAILHQFSLQVEKELGSNVLSIGYVGNIGRRLAAVPNVNSAVTCVPSGTTPVDAAMNCVTPYPNLPFSFTPNLWTAAARSRHDALQLSFRRRFHAGLTANANWTWGHTLSNSEVPIEGPGGGVPNCNQACYVDNPGGTPIYIADGWKTYEWSNADADVRHNLSLMLNYELPFGKSLKGIAGGVAKGWSVNLSGAWQTGLPFHVTDPGGPPGTAGPSGQLGPHNDLPNRVGDPWAAGTVAANPGCSAPSQVKTLNAWFNTCTYKVQANGTNGNSRRNTLRGPNGRRLDMGIAKAFAIREGMALQFRAEAFNLTNTPNFGLPGSGMPSGGGASTFGQIRSTAVGSNPRQIQLALRLAF
jgi:hypothetical protein